MKKIKKNMKVVVSVILALILSVNVSYAKTSSEETVPTSFTLEEAVNYAMNHNGDILKLKYSKDQLSILISTTRSGRKIVEMAIEGAELSGTSVIDAYSATQTNSFDGYLLRNKITEKRLERKQVLSDKSAEMTTEMIKILVENAYYNVLINKISYDDAVRNLDVVKNQTECGAIKLKYGTISEMDYKSLEISQNLAELSLVQAEYSYKEAKMDLNEMLGIKIDSEIELTSQLEINPVDITITEEKKKELREKDLAFMSAEEDYNVAVENEKYAKAYFGSSDKSYKNYKTQLENAEIDYKNAQNTLERKILSTYNNLDVLKKTLKIYEDKKNLMNLALGIQNIRLKYGTAIEEDVITASINYNTAVNDYYEMLLNYNMLARLYEKNIMA